MQQRTIDHLNLLNQAFYRTIAQDFSETRQTAWHGWARLSVFLPTVAPLRVLDVGCGNGRFAHFLREQHPALPIHYHGLDTSADLLSIAQQKLATLPNLSFELSVQDIVTHPLPPHEYDLVVLFGVIHHVPSQTRRVALMRDLTQCVATGGILAFAAWRFYENAPLRERLVEWDSTWEREEGDYLMDWRRGERALRYCHYVDDAEHSALVQATTLQERLRYRADGRDGQLNCYSILERA